VSVSASIESVNAETWSPTMLNDLTPTIPNVSVVKNDAPSLHDAWIVSVVWFPSTSVTLSVGDSLFQNEKIPLYPAHGFGSHAQ
jgi:hypothetical protein